MRRNFREDPTVQIISHNLETTEALGTVIGKIAPGGGIIAFRGDLGAGKTTISKAIARGLDVEELVTSPTFTIAAEYEGRLRLCHVDAYRLRSIEEFEEIGGFELYGGPDTLLLLEWSERFGDALPPETTILTIRTGENDERFLESSGSWLEDAFRLFIDGMNPRTADRQADIQ